MAKVAGHKAQIKCSGTAVTFEGEATTASANLTYQVTDASKQVFDQTATITVQLRTSTNNTAEVGTTSSNLTFDGHGLSTGDFIYNTTIGAGSTVTLVDSANLTLDTPIALQSDGDSIDFYEVEASTSYTLNRLSGKVIYPTTATRTIRVSGKYLPMTAIGEARELSYTISADNEECNTFGDVWKERKQTLKDFSASVSGFYVDNTYQEKLTDGSTLVLEIYVDSSSSFDLKAWVVQSSAEVSPAVDNIVPEDLEFEGTLDADSRCITLD